MCIPPTDSNKYFIAARSVNYTERKEASIFAYEDIGIINTTRLSIKNIPRIQKSNGRLVQKISATRDCFN